MLRPALPAVAQYGAEHDPTVTASVAGQVQRFQADQVVRPDWWRLFGNTDLDRLLERAVTRSPSLAAARATLERSQAELRAGRSLFYPQIDLDASAARERLTPLRQGIAAGGSVFNLYSLAASVGYSVDLFGARSHAVEGLAAQTEIDCAALQASLLTLTGNLVNAALASAAYREQLILMRQLIALQVEQISLLQARAQAGLLPGSSLLAAQAQLAELNATAAALEQRLRAGDDLMAALAGEAPAENTRPPLLLSALTLPQELPLQLPAAVLRQRPDVVVAEGRMRAAHADVGVATAQQFPDLTLSAGTGRSALSASALGQSAGNFWSAGADLHQTLFQAGAAGHRKSAAEAEFRAADAAYRQVVLEAIQQVADVLGALTHDAELAAARQAALDSADSQLALAAANRQAGRVADDEVLNARQQLASARLNWVAAQGARFQDTVALYVALGAGGRPDQRCLAGRGNGTPP